MKGTELNKIKSPVVFVNPRSRSVPVYKSEDLKTGFNWGVAFREVRRTNVRRSIDLKTKSH